MNDNKSKTKHANELYLQKKYPEISTNKLHAIIVRISVKRAIKKFNVPGCVLDNSPPIVPLL